MKIRANVSWDPEREYDEAESFDVTLNLENGEKQTFRGQLGRPEVVLHYLLVLYRQAVKQSREGIETVLKSEACGAREYEFLVTAEGDDLAFLRENTEKVQRRYYVAPRQEWVSHERYCAFYDSSGGLWKPELCDYPRGDFVEVLRQIAYDMRNVNPEVYRWGNVSNFLLLYDRMEEDPEFGRFIDERARPLSRLALALARKGDIEEAASKFEEMADMIESYDRKNAKV